MKRLDWKKRIILLAVIGAVVIGGGIAWKRMSSRQNTESASTGNVAMRTVILQKGDFRSTVSVKGVVKSEEVSSVAAPEAVKIIALNVREGDLVKKGDIIAILDSTAAKSEIDAKMKSIQQEKDELKRTFDKLTRSQEQAGTHKNQVDKLQSDLVSAAQKAADEAARAVTAFQTAYDTLKNDRDTADASIAAKQQAADAADAEQQRAYGAWVAAGQPASPAPEQAAYENAQNALRKAADELATAKSVYDVDSRSKAFEDAAAKMAALTQAREDAAAKLRDANDVKVRALQEEDRAITDLNEQAGEAKKKWTEYVGDDTLKELQRKLDSLTLKAETSGKVTELKATVGSVAKDTIATIQSTDKLILQVSVPAYDIQKVQLGQKAEITASTASDRITGTVSRIATTAGADDAAGFQVDIRIDDPGKAYIGTKADAEIILSEEKNVYTLPNAAISAAGDGSHIKVLQKDGTYRDEIITAGTSNAYYTVVSGSAIQENAEVLSNYDWESIEQDAKEKVKANDQ